MQTSINVLQIFLTIISAVVIFVFGQIIQMFWLQPILELRRIIGTISYQLTYYANVYTSTNTHKPEVYTKATEIFRELSCSLEEKYLTIPYQSFFSLLRVIPNKHEISEATSKLIFLSNGINDTSTARDSILDNDEAAKSIRKNLHITRFR